MPPSAAHSIGRNKRREVGVVNVLGVVAAIGSEDQAEADQRALNKKRLPADLARVEEEVVLARELLDGCVVKEAKANPPAVVGTRIEA